MDEEEGVVGALEVVFAGEVLDVGSEAGRATRVGDALSEKRACETLKVREL